MRVNCRGMHLAFSTERVHHVERATGIELTWPVWKFGDGSWP